MRAGHAPAGSRMDDAEIEGTAFPQGARIADSHLHLFANGFHPETPRPAEAKSDVETYERLRVQFGIEAGLVVGYQGENIDPQNNGYVRSLALKRDWMATLAFVPAWPPPRPAEIHRYIQSGHFGVCLYVRSMEEAGAICRWPSELWKTLENYSAIVSVNASPEAIGGLRRLVERFSACTFMFSHLGLPGRFASPPAIQEARARIDPLLSLSVMSSCYVKISGLYAISDPPNRYPHAAATPFIELLLEAFTPSRCMWGSDFSPSLAHVTFDRTLHVKQLEGLAPSDRNLVMGETLLRLLGRI